MQNSNSSSLSLHKSSATKFPPAYLIYHLPLWTFLGKLGILTVNSTKHISKLRLFPNFTCLIPHGWTHLTSPIIYSLSSSCLRCHSLPISFVSVIHNFALWLFSNWTVSHWWVGFWSYIFVLSSSAHQPVPFIKFAFKKNTYWRNKLTWTSRECHVWKMIL